MIPEMIDVRSARDPSWILRSARLLSERGTDLATLGRTPAFGDLTSAAQDQSESCRSLPPQLVQKELQAIIMSDGADIGLQWLQDTGVLPIWLPEVSATVDFSQ